MSTMTDLTTLLHQLNQHARTADLIIKTIVIPENINSAGQAHCQEYLERAMDYTMKVGYTFNSIAEQHPHDLGTQDIRTASAKQGCLLKQIKALSILMGEDSSPAQTLLSSLLHQPSNSPTEQAHPTNQLPIQPVLRHGLHTMHPSG